MLYYQLNLLLSIIIELYLNNSRCITLLYKNNNNINLENAPILIEKLVPTLKTIGPGINIDYCTDVIYEQNGSMIAEGYDGFPDFIRVGGLLGKRRKLILVTQSLINLDITIFEGTFADQVLIIIASQLSTQENITNINNFDSDEVFEMYTYKRSEITLKFRNFTFECLDLWFTKNQTFRHGNNLFPYEENGGGRVISWVYAYLVLANYKGTEIFNEKRGTLYHAFFEFARIYNYTPWKVQVADGIIPGRQIGIGAYEGIMSYKNRGRIKGALPSYPISTIGQLFLVPMHRVADAWLNYILVFSLLIWCLMMSVFIVIRLAFAYFKYLGDDWRINNLDMFGLFVSQGVPYIFESNLGRFLLLNGLIMSVYFGSLYNSGILDALLKVKYVGHYETIAELFANETMRYYLDIYETDVVLNYLMEDGGTHPMLRYSSEGLNYIENIQDPAEVEAGNVSILTYSYFSGIVETHGLNESRFRIIPERYRTMSLHFELARSFFAMDKFNEFLIRLWDTGLLIYWESEYVDGKLLRKQMILLDEKLDDDVHTQLNFNHIKGVMLLWIICVVFDLFFLSVEFFHSKLTHALFISI